MGGPQGQLEAQYKMKRVCVCVCMSVSVCTSLEPRATRHELTICPTRRIDILWNTRDTVHGFLTPAVGRKGTCDEVFGRRADLSRPLHQPLGDKGDTQETPFFLRLHTHTHI